MRVGAGLAMFFLILVAVAHLLRLVYRVEVTVGGVTIPHWPSVLAVAGPAVLAWLLWRERAGGGAGRGDPGPGGGSR